MKNFCVLRSLILLAVGLLAIGTGCQSKYDSTYAVEWSLTGTVWKVMEIDGQMVGAKVIPTLQLESGGKRVTAFGGVNNLSGTYQLDQDRLSFGQFISTRMAGEPKQMETEAQLVKALATVTQFTAKGPWLVLRSGDKVVARAQATAAVPFAAP